MRLGIGKDQKKLGKKECIFYNSGKVEIEKHFILECEAFKDNRDRYTNILTTSSWDNLFKEEAVEKVRASLKNKN